ncbi:exocyst complex component 5 [Lepeophtheirus salmonis]|uniref:exocyst complex component 5 n=1 Tax=Lepeophtheirus salmonis TaxID=72036 RepID=UPI001AE1FC63|nr:exocyst complex component 5-like [Lepeophtheirus salmonis]
MSTTSSYWRDVEQESFDPEEFVERLAWRSVGANEFDAEALDSAFSEAIRELNRMQESQAIKVKELETSLREEETIHWKRTTTLVDRNKSAAMTYRSLDEKINSVATKVVHLGDQLEAVNVPRSRDVAALNLMRHFHSFIQSGDSLSPLFTDKSRLHEAAEIIQKLQLIAQDLPPKKFEDAKARIDAKHSEIENSLIEEFIKSHRSNDKERMKDLTVILSSFKGYNECVDSFIEQIQLKKFRGKDIFKHIVPLCESSWTVIKQVFPNPQQVMGKFILNIYHSKLKDHIEEELGDKSQEEAYLNNLFTVYSKTSQLTTELARFNLGGSDHLFLTNLNKGLFKRYLETYISTQCKFLNDRCARILQKYYEAKGHTKKSLSGNALGFRDLKREFQGVIASKANINIEMDSYGGETFLSEEVAINILQLTKMAFRRCQVLSTSTELPSNAMEIFNILISFLIHEHIDYAVEIALQGIPLPECKISPELYFFDVIGQANAIVHLLEKQFSDSLVPLVASTPKYDECLQIKKKELEKLEQKLDAGLDRTLSALVGWVKTILTTEQRKSDFISSECVVNSSSACLKTVRFISAQVEKIKESMDGKNIEIVLLELGTRLHRTIFEHLQSFNYSSTGAMSVICDVNEYRKVMATFKVPLVSNLFDTLHAMCNLLILPPNNLRGATQGPQLANLDRTIIDNWIQLRLDYKTDKLGSYI